MLLLLTFLIGLVAGLRTMTALFAVSLGSWLDLLSLDHTYLAWLGYAWTPWLLGLLAIAELAMDKSSRIPKRTAPSAFGGRLLSGAIAGAAVGIAAEAWLPGLGFGILGAIVGTLVGYRMRQRVSSKLGRDLPVALAEDGIAIGLAFAVIATAARMA